MKKNEAKRMDPEEVARKRKQIEDIINRCGRLTDEDLQEIFGGATSETTYTATGSSGSTGSSGLTSA